jgi:hypothetical protein
MATNAVFTANNGGVTVNFDTDDGHIRPKTYPFTAVSGELITTDRGGTAFVLRPVGTAFEIIRNASRTDDRGYGISIFGSTDPAVSNTAFQNALTVGGSGGGTATLSQADKDTIAKISTLETQLTDVAAGFVDDGKELTAGEDVKAGFTRIYTVGDVVFALENRIKDKRKVANPIDVAELNKWLVKSQYPVTSNVFPANSLIPKGYNLSHTDGSILINKMTRVTGESIDFAQWDVEVKSLAKLETWIASEGNVHTAGQQLLTGDSRRIVLGGVSVQINYRGDNTDSCPALSIGELLYWEYVGQNLIPTTYPGAGLAIKGYQYRHTNGQLLQVKDNANLSATFDVSQWDVVAEGKVVREVNGGTINALTLLDAPENAFFLNGVTVQNGPGNAAQNVTGWLYTTGDGKNGVIVLTVTAGNNVGTIGGTWSRRLTTPAPTVPVPNPTTTIGDWTRTPLNVAPTASTNNGDVFTGSTVAWDLSHNIKANFTMAGPITLTPQADWSTRTGQLTIPTGTLTGTFPTYGTDPVELVYSPSPIGWTIKTKPISLRAGKSIHNFGVAGVTVLKGIEHNLGEVHIENGGNYSIAAADWFDGMSIRFTHTAGQNTQERLIVSGFAGAYLRDGTSRDISGGLFIGRQDCKFTITITENGGAKYLNIVDLSRDAHAIAGYTTLPAGVTAGMLINVSGATIAKANAIAPNALPATHYVDVVSGALTPLYEDGCIFKLPSSPAALSTAKAGDSLFLGADGLFSVTTPAIVAGNIRQPVAVVRPDGRGMIKLRAPATITV